jgi:beta-xylosidase
MNTKLIHIISTVLLLLSLGVKADNIVDYRNPIINADVPDVSLCRVGDYYYMVSTTMHLMPGAPIMRSSDMKRWEIISYVFRRIDDGDRYNLIGSTAYGQGQWASSIRYHDGLFYVWFTANGAPGKGFIYTASSPEGPWALLSRPKHLHDGSLFFDDDGRVYIFNGTGHLTELKRDLSDVLPGGTDLQLFERDSDEQGLLEGSSVIKHNGKYYLLMISMDWSIPGRLRREVCYRADCIIGPYEKRVILETEFEGYGGVGQGCIVDGAYGQWYGLIFQDRGGIGRVPCLMPCNWTSDGWPMLGDENGRIPNNTNIGYADMSGICGSDDFNSIRLSLHWQWNHNPVDSCWSLTERPGVLRLRTARVVPNLFVAPNTLTQRMTGPECTATVLVDFRHMKDGDVAGFTAFNGDSGVLAIECVAGQKYIVMSEQKSQFDAKTRSVVGVEVDEVERIKVSGHKIYFKIHGDFNRGKDIATFSYSRDGKKWVEIGRPIKMVFDYTRFFMGSRFGIFNYATKTLGGYVDVEDFTYSFN